MILGQKLRVSLLVGHQDADPGNPLENLSITDLFSWRTFVFVAFAGVYV
ncbi:MAG: hypothetical protein HGB06_01445 [Chlorobaculum sp.]|nr:hypothetical protein [Chlorobaculum sp.]